MSVDNLGAKNTENSHSRNSFAQWAATVSHHTNRSLAGSRIYLNDFSEKTYENSFVTSAQNWGMIPVNSASEADFDGTTSHETLRNTLEDATKLSGKDAIDYAQSHMPVTRTLLKNLTNSKKLNLQGLRIAVCLVLEPKTAVLLRELKSAGAEVGVFCAPEETDQRVADQLVNEGIVVEANVNWTAEETHQGALNLLDTIKPQIIIDDGASFARLASLERPEIAKNLIGVAEETTSGVRAFEAMQEAGKLTYPVVAVNDSIMKTGFDNRHGTGETCVTTLQNIIGSEIFNKSCVTVVGYGPVGRGFALRVRALGAKVIVCDTNPIAALQAVFDGFEALDIEKALEKSDIVISATGVRHTITLQHLCAMKEKTIVAVIGGIANEIALDDVPDFKPIPGADIREINLPNGKSIKLISEGNGTNYTSGGGNPIEIMDFSFAVQISALEYLIKHANLDSLDSLDSRLNSSLPANIYRLPESSDKQIAKIALESRKYSSSSAVEDNGYHWDLTRFAEEAS